MVWQAKQKVLPPQMSVTAIKERDSPLHDPVSLHQHRHLLDATQNSHRVDGGAQEAHQVGKRHDLH